MSNDFGAQWWERHYQENGGHPNGEPSPYVIGELADLTPGTVLEAGCGTGADARWLAARGWDVTAVDISPTAIARARASSDGDETDSASISWVVADLMTWSPPGFFDVVVSQYLHPDSPFSEFVSRLAGAVAAAGTLLIVGHDRSDHLSSHAPRDASMDTTAVTDILDCVLWTVEVDDTRHRKMGRGDNEVTIVDNVVKARRRS